MNRTMPEQQVHIRKALQSFNYCEKITGSHRIIYIPPSEANQKIRTEGPNLRQSVTLFDNQSIDRHTNLHWILNVHYLIPSQLCQ